MRKEYRDLSIKHKSLFAIILIALGIIFRTVWHLGPNVEFVTAAAILSAFYLGRKWAMTVPLSIMVISDAFIGNTSIFIFTWSAYILIGLGGWYLSSSKFKVQSSKFKILLGTGLGITASVWFYLWTNFGVWLLDSWGMYPKTLSGLASCYIMAIPFLKYNLVGNLIFVPSSFLLTEAFFAYDYRFSVMTGIIGKVRKVFHI